MSINTSSVRRGRAPGRVTGNTGKVIGKVTHLCSSAGRGWVALPPLRRYQADLGQSTLPFWGRFQENGCTHHMSKFSFNSNISSSNILHRKCRKTAAQSERPLPAWLGFLFSHLLSPSVHRILQLFILLCPYAEHWNSSQTFGLF